MARGGRSMCVPNLPAQPLHGRQASVFSSGCVSWIVVRAALPLSLWDSSQGELLGIFHTSCVQKSRREKEQACLLCSGTQSLSFILI